MQITDHVLTINDYTQELPKLAKPATVTAYQVPTEYRASGYFVAVTPNGDIPEVPACDSKDAALIGTLELPADEGAQLDQAKAERLALIATECDKVLATVKTSYPQGEVESWPQQVKEAEALAVDPQAAAPLLSAIATYRGLTVADLAARVSAKASAYAAASGAIIGKRQALEDAISNASTAEDVSLVAW
jgi:hypothetical protein